MQYTKSNEDADEIVNDTFLAIWEKKDQLILDDSLKSYLYTTVKNKSLNWLKKRKVELTELDSNFDLADSNTSAIEILQAKETEAAIFELIEKLPNKCKQIFVLSRKEQLPNKEIAAILELSEKTIENQITIAIKMIKNGLKKKQNDDNGFKIHFLPWMLLWLELS